jgi:hypothetical protein
MPELGLINTRLSGYKEEDLSCGTWTFRTPFKTGALVSFLPFKKVFGKTKNKMAGPRPERHITDPRSKRVEETSRRQKRMETSSEGQAQKEL